jgi:hypothetical protein
LLKDILAGRRLEELVDRARAAEALDAQVRALLPPELAAHVTGASLREDAVVVLVDSAAWASRLRFYAPELAARLAPRTDGQVDRVRVRVAPPPGGPSG